MSDPRRGETASGGGNGRILNRRTVLRGLGAVGLGGSVPGAVQADERSETTMSQQNAEEIPTSTQFWTYNESDLSVAELIYESANAGYDAVEPFRIDDEEAVAEALEDTGLELSSAHVDIETLEEEFESTVRTYSAFGADALVHAYKDDETWQSEAAIVEWAERVNEMADRLAEEGMAYGYHNHDQEFQTVDGTFGFDIFADHVDDNVHLQLDVGWALVGGADPVAVLERHSDKIGSLHMKDMTEDGEFTEIGEGDVDMEAVANAARSGGDVDYLVYEYDGAPNPIESMYTGARVLERLNGPRHRDGAPQEAWPPRVRPGDDGLGADPPSDATILWNGEEATLDGWRQYPDGGDAEWFEQAEYFEINVGSGAIQPAEAMGDCHLHLEWRVPTGLEAGGEEADGDDDGQGPGNSGLFMMEAYEFQILQSYENPTYPSGYAGSYYLADPEGEGDAPLVLPIRPPGEWQAYDMIWRGPRFEDGEAVRLPQATLFFNGVAVQVHNDIPGPNWWMDVHDFDHEEHGHPRGEDGQFLEEVPFYLQDHGNETDEVHFRNVWYRDLPADPVETGDSGSVPEYGTAGGDWEEPEQVAPGGIGTTGDAPADAQMLIEGGELGAWESAGGGETDWNEAGDYVEVEPGAGDIRTQASFGDAQYHVEYRVPEDVEGAGADRGASGVLAMGEYEVQILDTFLNPVDAEAWAGAYLGQSPPHHDAVRRPGQWQRLDVVWQGPRFENGELARAAQASVLLNGVAVQTRLVVAGPNADGSLGEYEEHAAERPLRLQEDGSRVQFRNTWARPLDP